MSTSSLLYLNGAFDVALSAQSAERFQEQIDEMTAWYLPVAEVKDRVLLKCSLPEDYTEYWRRLGIQLPGMVGVNSSCSGFQGDAWGWDQQAVDVLKNCGAELHHPTFDSVKKANSRQFSHQLAQEHALGIPNAQCCGSFEEVRQIVGGWQTQGPLVVKPAFGNSAIGFVHLASKQDFSRKKNRIQQLFNSAESCATVEPWFERLADFSSHFVLDEDGEIGPIQRYSTLITSGGAFYGMRLGFDPVADPDWREQLDSMVDVVSPVLHYIGYFGPVSIDSMVVSDGNGSPFLVPLVEINARWSMFRIASCVHQRLAPHQQGLFRTLGRKRHQLPLTYQELRKLLGSLAFDPETRCGVVCVSPLLIKTKKDWQQPARTLLLVAANNEDELNKMNRSLSQLLNLNPKSA